MARAVLTDVLPEQIVTHVIEPYYDFMDRVLHYLDGDELDITLWKRMFEQRYPSTYNLRMDPALVQDRALSEAPTDQELLIITMILGYFDTFSPVDAFSYKNRDKFTDLVTWVYVKQYQHRIDLTEFLLSQYMGLVKTYKFSTLLFLVKQVGVVFNIYSFLEEFVTVNRRDEYDDEDEISDMGIRHRNELIRRVIDHGIAGGYRPLDHHFTPHGWRLQVLVFEYLIVNVPELAEHYIDTFEVDEVLDYMLLNDTDTYLHTAARVDNPSIYHKLQAKKPILARIKNRNGQYASDIRSGINIL